MKGLTNFALYIANWFNTFYVVASINFLTDSYYYLQCAWKMSALCLLLIVKIILCICGYLQFHFVIAICGCLIKCDRVRHRKETRYICLCPFRVADFMLYYVLNDERCSLIYNSFIVCMHDSVYIKCIMFTY